MKRKILKLVVGFVAGGFLISNANAFNLVDIDSFEFDPSNPLTPGVVIDGQFNIVDGDGDLYIDTQFLYHQIKTAFSFKYGTRYSTCKGGLYQIDSFRA